MLTRTIAVCPAQEYQANLRFFDSLAALHGVKFEAADSPVIGATQPVLWIGPAQPPEGDLPFFIASAGFSSPGPASGGCELRFSSSPLVPPSFREATLQDSSIAAIVELPCGAGETPAAWIRSACVWCAKQGAQPGFVSGLPLPRLQNNRYPWHSFNTSQWAGLLPLLQWLRLLTAPDWTYPTPQAAFIIDDPNLHSSTYGHIRFPELVRSAARFNYHAAVATIPFDAWYVNSDVVNLFRDHSDRLSLLMHGNDHINNELARPDAEGSKLASLAQALKRIDRLERKTGLAVSRVMAAPHGACDMDSGRIMQSLGYQAACISVGSLLKWNPNADWPLTFGMQQADLMPGGRLPVFHRFALKHYDVQIRLAAFLHQPTVFTLHHTDVRRGFDEIEAIATRVNSVSAAVWTNLASIASSCYATIIEGENMRVRMFANQIALPLPTQVKRLSIEAPDSTPLAIELAGFASQPVVLEGAILSVSSGMLHISLPTARAIDFRSVPSPSLSPWAILRRALCETRDRTLGLTARLSG